MSKYIFNRSKENTEPPEIYRSAVKSFSRRGVISKHPNDIHSCDLIDMTGNPDGHFKYILNCVDVFTRKLYSEPLANKDKFALQAAFNSIWQKAKPTKIWTDKEGGILSTHFKEFLKLKGVEHYTTDNSSIVERLNRTMNEAMVKVLGEGVKGWAKFIPEFVEVYNNAKHRTLGMAPNEAFQKEEQVRSHHLSQYNEPREEPKHQYKINEKVRIQTEKNIFTKKSRTPNWTKEIFTIKAIHDTLPKTYTLTDEKGHEIGKKYGYQLMPAH